MSKENDLLNLDELNAVVQAKDRTETILQRDRQVSPTSQLLVSGIQEHSTLGRALKRRDAKKDLEDELETLKQELETNAETFTLGMPNSQQTIKFKKILIDPELIDVSPENQRVQSLLDTAAVSDIFESILNEGQSEPGFVRPKGKGRYELVSGSRRLFCVKQIPERKYLAFTGDIPDVDVRRLSRLENKQSPISAYERALSYKQDIDAHRFKTWEALGAVEGISTRQLQKYKALAELPVEIVMSFTAPSDLSLGFTDWIISKLHKDKTAKKKLIAMAQDLIMQKQGSDALRSSQDVISIYKSGLRIRNEGPTPKKPVFYESSTGDKLLKHTVSSKGTHKFEFAKLPEAKIQKVLDLIQKELGLEG